VKAYADPSAEIERIIQKAEAGLSGLDDPADRQRLLSNLVAIRAYVAWIKGEADKALGLARRGLGITRNMIG